MIVASAAVTLLFSEAALRIIGFRYTPLRIERVDNFSEWRYYHAFEDRNFEYDPQLFWRPRPGGEFNAQGYRRLSPVPPKDSSHFRIVAVGDSNTLGWLGNGNPNWPKFLEELDPKLEVVNAGVYGYTSFQGVRRLEQSLTLQPDLALISFGANDGMRVSVSDLGYANQPVRTLSLDRRLMETRLGQLVLKVLDKMSGRGKQVIGPRVSVPEYKENLSEIIAIGKKSGVRIVLLTRPFTGDSQDPLWWKNFAPEYNAATLKVAQNTGTQVIDVYGHFHDKTPLFADESHFTEEGHREMAKFVFAEIHSSLDPLRPEAKANSGGR